MTSGEVTLKPCHVREDLVGLVQDLDNIGDATVRVCYLRQIGEGWVVNAESCHEALLYVHAFCVNIDG